MGISLFLKECKQNMKSLTYLVYICCLVLFYITQLGEVTVIEKPMPGQKRYGTMRSDDEKVQMECALTQLFESFDRNYYVTYPLGFYKSVELSEEEQEEVKEILEELSGKDIEQLESAYADYQEEIMEKMMGGGETSMADVLPFSIVPDTSVSYEKFLEKMKEIDSMLGGGSSFSEKSVKSGGSVEMTYEQALEEYEKIVQKDKVSGAYARLFCDYFGIMLAILPVFLAVTRAVRDQRAKAFEVIASKKISSAKLILIRYLGVVVTAMVPVIVLAISSAMQGAYLAKSLGAPTDLMMYGKYLGGWLLPSVLFSVSAGFFFSELFSGTISILVMALFWIANLFQSVHQLTGMVGWNVMPRFNSLGERTVFESIFRELAINRIGYTAAAILFILATVLLYDRKRKGGRLFGGKHH